MSTYPNSVEKTLQTPKPSKLRKRLKSLTIILSIFIITISVAGINYARNLKKTFDDGPGAFIMSKLVEDLNLSSEQEKKVEKIRQEIKTKFESKKSSRESTFNEFVTLFKQDQLDQNELKQLAEKKESEREEMKKFIGEKIVEFHSILTPEQRQIASQKMVEMRSKLHDKMNFFKGE